MLDYDKQLDKPLIKIYKTKDHQPSRIYFNKFENNYILKDEDYITRLVNFYVQ